MIEDILKQETVKPDIKAQEDAWQHEMQLLKHYHEQIVAAKDAKIDQLEAENERLHTLLTAAKICGQSPRNCAECPLEDVDKCYAAF